MLFSIVVPTYNNLPELQRCLAALEDIPSEGHEVWVCVDGSTDGTLEWLAQARMRYPLHVLQHPGGRNCGRAATRNLALPHAQGQYVLFLDSDMEAGPDLLERHRAQLGMAEGAVSIGAIKYRDPGRNVWVRYTAERGVAKYAHGAEVPFHYFITPNTAMPTRYFRALGGFDAAINRYGGEDMELGYRVQQRFAPRFVYNAEAAVTTTQPKTLDEALPQLQEYGATGLRYIVQKWPDLNQVYWVHRCARHTLGDRLFEGLTRQPFRGVARALMPVMPYFIQKFLVSFLVICAIHAGFRGD